MHFYVAWLNSGRHQCGLMWCNSIYFIQVTASWCWISPVAGQCTPSTRTRRASWTSARATSSPSPDRWTPTGTRARCAANLGCSPSATWTCWCLCRCHDNTFNTPSLDTAVYVQFFNNMQLFGSGFAHFRELISRRRVCVTGREGHISHCMLSVTIPASELRLALENTPFLDKHVCFPLRIFNLISDTKPFSLLHI